MRNHEDDMLICTCFDKHKFTIFPLYLLRHTIVVFINGLKKWKASFFNLLEHYYCLLLKGSSHNVITEHNSRKVRKPTS